MKWRVRIALIVLTIMNMIMEGNVSVRRFDSKATKGNAKGNRKNWYTKFDWNSFMEDRVTIDRYMISNNNKSNDIGNERENEIMR